VYGKCHPNFIILECKTFLHYTIIEIITIDIVDKTLHHNNRRKEKICTLL